MTDPVCPAALAIVKESEGLYLKSYICPAGKWTIGWGHTRGVKEGQSIPRAQAEAYLAEDMAEAAAAVDRLVKVPLTPNQRGALASFAFNLGAGSLQQSTLLKLLNQGDYAGAADEFPKWVFATVDGKKQALPGLKKRRAAERALFLTP